MDTETATKTCTLTIVEPGLPDRVIKITPARHEKEKIWLDNRPGLERWAAVQQLLRQFCPRGKYVPEPAFWHQPGAKPEEISVLTLLPENIPHAQLDGAVFEPLPKQERPHLVRPVDAMGGVQDRVSRLESRLDGLNDSISSLVKVLSQRAPAAEGRTALDDL